MQDKRLESVLEQRYLETSAMKQIEFEGNSVNQLQSTHGHVGCLERASQLSHRIKR